MRIASPKLTLLSAPSSWLAMLVASCDPGATPPVPDEKPPCASATRTFDVEAVEFFGGDAVLEDVVRDGDLTTMRLNRVDELGEIVVTFSAPEAPALPSPGSSVSIEVGEQSGFGEGSTPAYWRLSDALGVALEGGNSDGAIDEDAVMFANDGPTLACDAGAESRKAIEVGFRGDDGDVFLAADETTVIARGGVEHVAVSLGGIEYTFVFEEECGDCPSPGAYVERHAYGYTYRRAVAPDATTRVGDVYVVDQGGLDALAGVRFIRQGGLSITTAEDLDLTPLSSLEEIDSFLVITGPEAGAGASPSAAPIASLDPLASLRVLGAPGVDFSLLKLSVLVDDLTPLAGLQADVSSLAITDSPSLRDLAPLAGVTWSGLLSVERNASLTTFTGPAYTTQEPARAPSVTIRDNGALTSLAALSTLTRADVIEVSGCLSLVDLSGLSALREVERSLGLVDVGAQSLAGLSSVTSLSHLFLRGASWTSLDGLPAQPGSFALRALRVEGAPSLVSLDAVTAAVGLQSVSLIDVPALTSIAAVPALTQPGGGAGELELTRTGLSSIDGLSGQVALTPLIVRENSALTELGLPALTSAGALNLSLNTSLPQPDAEAFAARVGSVGTKVLGNVGDDVALPLVDCPFQDDAQCDEPSLCASDLCDCDISACGAD